MSTVFKIKQGGVPSVHDRIFLSSTLREMLKEASKRLPLPVWARCPPMAMSSGDSESDPYLEDYVEKLGNVTQLYIDEDTLYGITDYEIQPSEAMIGAYLLKYDLIHVKGYCYMVVTYATLRGVYPEQVEVAPMSHRSE